MLSFAGIRRSNKFSPNHIGNDSTIFELTARNLRQMGHTVNEYTEEACRNGIIEQHIFSMAREPQVARMLQSLEDGGATVINSGYGMENCYRSNMTRLLDEGEVPTPDSITIETCYPDIDYFHALGDQGFWIKRGDFHAIHKEDVCFIRNAEEGSEMIREYALRGIETAVLCKHIKGDLVKFYGVCGTDFFYWFYPTETGHSKFGNEAINGKTRHTAFSPDMLNSVANQAASLLNVAIYGGDAIITPEGKICIIDLNDWPSFAPCREQAADVIARYIANNSINKNE